MKTTHFNPDYINPVPLYGGKPKGDDLRFRRLNVPQNNEIKQQVSQMVFDIKKQVQRKAYWNATKIAHDLFDLLNSLPYVEADNPPIETEIGQGGQESE